jgi:hypothetical protein
MTAGVIAMPTAKLRAFLDAEAKRNAGGNSLGEPPILRQVKTDVFPLEALNLGQIATRGKVSPTQM